MNIDLLLEELEEGKCALVLGPEFHLINSEKEEAITSLRDYLYQTERLKEMQYLSEDGFFYLKGDPNERGDQKQKISSGIRHYYEELKPPIPDHYLFLARLPFHLIISLSPDELIRNAFDEIKKPYEYTYFAMGEYFGEDNRRKSDGPINDASSGKPMIFNLLGSNKNRESMVFTYDSLFKFFYNLFPLEKLSQKFKAAVYNTSSFLFLGFNYDKWYLKLIFFLLTKIREDKGSGGNLAIYTGDDKTAKVKEFYKDQMSFKFNEVKAYEFIKSLYSQAVEKKLVYVTPESKVNSTDDQATFKIVYICAVPDDRTPIPVDREFKKIEQLWKSSDNRANFELKPLYASTKAEMINIIDKELPHFVMISAHGSPGNELLFTDENGSTVPLELAEMCQHMKFFLTNPRSNLQYLLLNCCNSDEYARTMLNYVCHSIGMKGVIGVEASLAFSEGFFTKYFQGRDFTRSFEFGKHQILSANQTRYQETPKCFDAAGN